MNDLISKTAVIEILSTMQGRCDTKAALVQNSKIWQQVKDMPTVEAIPVEWINKYANEHRAYIHAFAEMVVCYYEEDNCDEQKN